MGRKVYFYKGLMLPGSLIGLAPRALPRRPSPEKVGVDRKRGRLSPRSANFIWELPCKVAVQPQTGIVIGNALDSGPQMKLLMRVIQWQRAAIDLSDSLGDLSWVENTDYKLTVTGMTPGAPGSYPAAVAINYSGAGFAPAAGFYVLLRDPTTKLGVVVQVTGTGGGAITCTIPDMSPGTQAVPAAGWEIYLVNYYFPRSMYENPGGIEYDSQAMQKYISEWELMFKSADDAVYPTAYVVDLDATT